MLNVVLAVLLIMVFWVYILWSNARATNKKIQRVAQQQSIISHDETVRISCRAIHLLQPGAHAGIDYIVSIGGPEQGPYITEWLNSKILQPETEEIEQALLKTSVLEPEKDYAAQRLKEYSKYRRSAWCCLQCM
jgi:hypothetical protein